MGIIKKVGIVLLCGMAILLILIGMNWVDIINDKITASLVIILGMLIIIACILPLFKFYKQKWIKRGHRILTIILLAAFVFCTFVSSFMLLGVNTYHGQDFDGTIIVLGAKANGKSPSIMLKARLDGAFDFLQQNPKCTCIVSGGQGSDETYTEAWVMKNYLTEKGIGSDRILSEDKSESTEQNIEYSLDLIEQKNLSGDVIIVTNFFHRYRALLYAQDAGLDAQSVSGTCRMDLEIIFWFREIAAVVKTWIFN